jgi:hypothetical protein
LNQKKTIPKALRNTPLSPRLPSGDPVEMTDELFPKQEGEDLMGEDFLDELVMETTDMVKGTIRGCASFGHQTVNVRMEIDAIAEGLDHGHHCRHKLKACSCVQEFHK